MTCEKCIEKLWGYLQNETSKEENNLISRHLEECLECQEKAKKIKKIISSLDSLREEELPSGYHEELMMKINNINNINNIKTSDDKVVELNNYRKSKPIQWKNFSFIAAAVLLVVATGKIGTPNFMSKPSDTHKEMLEKGVSPIYLDKENSGGGVQENTIEGSVDDQPVTYSIDIPKIEMPEIKTIDIDSLTSEIDMQASDKNTSVASSPQVRTREVQASVINQVITLEVSDMNDIFTKIEEKAVSVNGYQVGSDYKNYIEVSIPYQEFDGFLNILNGFGSVKGLENSEDVADVVMLKINIQKK